MGWTDYEQDRDYHPYDPMIDEWPHSDVLRFLRNKEAGEMALDMAQLEVVWLNKGDRERIAEHLYQLGWRKM